MGKKLWSLNKRTVIMGEHRKPSEVWFRRLPKKMGKKPPKNDTIRIELFPAYLWARHWEPGSSLFSPKLPLHSVSRRDYWVSRFRIRVNGKWIGSRAKFVTYTKEMIRERYFR